MKTAEIKTGGELNKGLIEAQTSCSVQEALDIMKKNRIHHLIVNDASTFVGIISDRELFHQPTHSSLGDIAKRNLPTIDENSDVSEVLRVIAENNLDAVAVVKAGKLTGIVTTSDMVRVLHGLHKQSGVQNLVSQGEAILASPMVQNFLNALSSVGV